MGAAPITQPASPGGRAMHSTEPQAEHPARSPQERGDGPVEGKALAVAPRWIAVGLVALAAFSGPLLFGAVETWAWAALWALVAAAAAATLFVWISEGRIAVVPAPVALLAALLVLVALVQLVPVPTGVFSVLGQRTRDVHRLLFGSRWHPVSLAPCGTFEALLKASLVLMLVGVALTAARTRAMVFTLVAAVAASALVASALGIVQEKTGRERIYRFRDLTQGTDRETGQSAVLDPALSTAVARIEAVKTGEKAVFFRTTVKPGDVFGPYANSNHFAGLVEIAVPVFLAMTLALLARRRTGWGEEGGFTGTAEGALVLLFGFAVVLGTFAVLYAGSLGGLGGLAAGSAAVLIVMGLSRQAGKVIVIAGLVALITCGALLAAADGDLAQRVSDKLSERAEVRAPAWQAARDLPWVGSGLGTYRYVAPHYEESDARYLFAHNDYVQLVTESGLVVAVLAGAFVLWQAAVLVKGAFRRSEPYCAALCAGAFGAMAAIGLHSFVDFNLHVPANAANLAVIVSAAAVARRSRLEDIETVVFGERVVVARRGRVTLAALFILILLAVAGAGVAAKAYANAASNGARRLLGGVNPAQAGAARDEISASLAQVSRASRVLPFDADLFYRKAALLQLASLVSDDEGRKAQLAAESLRAAVRAARLSPVYPFYALTSVTMGAGGAQAVEYWQARSTAYKWTLARVLFEEDRVDEGLALAREAVALEATHGSQSPLAVEIVGELLSRFRTYRRIQGAVPDSFGGHFFFARGLSAAGVTSGALEEYRSAAALAGVATAREGFSERAVLELGGSLAALGDGESAGRLYRTALERYPRWQYLRLEYARRLADDRRWQEALAEVELILVDEVSEELSSDAVALRKKLQR